MVPIAGTGWSQPFPGKCDLTSSVSICLANDAHDGAPVTAEDMVILDSKRAKHVYINRLDSTSLSLHSQLAVVRIFHPNNLISNFQKVNRSFPRFLEIPTYIQGSSPPPVVAALRPARGSRHGGLQLCNK